MKTININTPQIEELISLVSKHPALYDANNVEYADLHKRDLIWAEIGTELHLSADLCRAKWTILRSGYRKALRSRRAYVRRKWRFEDNMSFLEDCIQKRRNKSRQEQRQNMDCNISEDEDGCDIKIEPEEINFEGGVQEDDKTSSCDSIPVADLVKRLQAEAARNTTFVQDGDAVTQFFKSMAETVKSFPLLMQAEVKAEVFRCVSNAEIKFLKGRD